jgi:dienelactone hydrolase
MRRFWTGLEFLLLPLFLLCFAATAVSLAGPGKEPAPVVVKKQPSKVAAVVVPFLLQENWAPDKEPLDIQLTPLAPRETEAGKTIRRWEVRYTSHEWKGEPVRIFGFLACPERKAKEKLPALLLVHGGGGYATLDRVVEAAERGFVALSIDLPGKGTNRENFSRSSGPDMTVEQIYTVMPSLRESYLYHAIRAQRRAISLLAQRPEVDTTRIGMMGASWGGASGLITTSLDKRVRCFVNVFGAGYVREGSTWEHHFAKMPAGAFDRWEANYDAARYVGQIKVPVLGVAATNDGCYWLPQFMKTLREVGSKNTQLLVLPNKDHKLDAPAHTAIYRWLEAQLSTQKTRLPDLHNALRIASQLQETKDASGKARRMASVSVALSGPAPHRIEVSYAPVLAGEGHTRRVWHTLKGQSGEAVQVPVPTDLTYVFATVIYRDGSRYSTPVHTVGRMAMASGYVHALPVPFMTNRTAEVVAQAQAVSAKTSTAGAPVGR